jgi:hypothetical protein
VFQCLKVPTQREFIFGLGYGIYGICGPKLRTIFRVIFLFKTIAIILNKLVNFTIRAAWQWNMMKNTIESIGI